MIGMAMRSVRGIEVTDEALTIDAMRTVAEEGTGHYLGHPMTLERMMTEHFFPRRLIEKALRNGRGRCPRRGLAGIGDGSGDFVDLFTETYSARIELMDTSVVRHKIPAEHMRAHP